MRAARRFTHQSENLIGIDLSSGYNLSNGFFNYFIDKVFNIFELFLGKGV